MTSTEVVIDFEYSDEYLSRIKAPISFSNAFSASQLASGLICDLIGKSFERIECLSCLCLFGGYLLERVAAHFEMVFDQ